MILLLKGVIDMYRHSKNQKLTCLILLLFIGMSILPCVSSNFVMYNNGSEFDEKTSSLASSVQNPDGMNTVQQNGNNFSFQGNASSESNWYVVRFSSEKQMIIENCSFTVYCIQNRTGHFGPGYRVLLTNFQTTAYNYGELAGGTMSGEFYLQVDSGPLNFTVDRLDYSSRTGMGCGPLTFPHPGYPTTLSPGDWYFIIYTNHDGTVIKTNEKILTGKIEVSMNVFSEGNVTFYNPTEGHSDLYYESQDFHGKIVHKVPKFWLPYLLNGMDYRSRSIVRDGKAQFMVNHTFIGHFLPTFGYTFGHDVFDVITPQGTDLKLNSVIIMGGRIVQKGDFAYWDCIIGGNGTWTLDVDQIAFGKFPFVCFMGADIQLPDAGLQSIHTPHEIVLQTSRDTFGNRVLISAEKQEFIYSLYPTDILPLLISTQ